MQDSAHTSFPPATTRFSPIAGGITTIVAVTALIGWAGNIEALKRIHPAFVAMNPVTALCLALAGIGLILAATGATSRTKQVVTYLVATLVLVAGGIKLFGYATGYPIRLDALLFRMELHEVRLRIPNQMAPNTALNFVLIGLGLLTFNWVGRRFPISNVLALLASVFSLLAIVGYIYGVTQFTQLSPVFIPMALHTAICFLLLALGILYGDQRFPLRQMLAIPGISRVIAVRLFPAATLFVIALGWVRLYGERERFFPNVMGTALFVVLVVVVLTVLTWWTASTAGEIERRREQAEASLRVSKTDLEESNRHLQLIMNHAAELICSLDANHRFLSLNEASESLLGVPPKQLVNQSLADLIHSDDRDRAMDAMKIARTAANKTSVQFRSKRRDGTFIAIAWSFQWSAHYQTLYGVGRAMEDADSLRAWAEAS